MTSKLTWTFGLRDTFNSNPLNPHDQIARLRGSFDSISHDVNQPLNAAIQTASRQSFLVNAARDSAAANGDRVAVRAEFRAASRLRYIQRHPARQRRRFGRRESALRADVPGRAAWARVGGTAIAPGVPEQRGGRDRRREPELCFGISLRASFPARLRWQIRPLVFRPSRSRRSQMANFTRRISWSGVSGSSINLEARPACTRNTWARAR